MGNTIWVQSSTPINGISAYLNGVQEQARKALSPDFDVSVFVVPEGSTPDLHFMSYEFLNSRAILKNVLQAEKEGYAAVVMHCFLDPVPDEARNDERC